MAGQDLAGCSRERRPRKRRRRRRRLKPASPPGTGPRIGARVKPISATGSRRRKQPAAAAGSATAKTSKAKGASKKRSPKKGTPRRHMSTQREVSAGGVVYRGAGEDIEVVLASRRTRRGDLAWGLAKG